MPDPLLEQWKFHQDILVGGICPSIEDPTDCEVRRTSWLNSSLFGIGANIKKKTTTLCFKANLPGFWAGIATLLWPEYWNPEVGRNTIQSLKLSLKCKVKEIWLTPQIQPSSQSIPTSHQADWMCAPTCAAPEQTNMTCDDCKTGIHVKNFRGKIQNERMFFYFQAAIDQLLEEHTLDLIVDGLANGDFCANIGSF